jgi:hypothetical protein
VPRPRAEIVEDIAKELTPRKRGDPRPTISSYIYILSGKFDMVDGHGQRVGDGGALFLRMIKTLPRWRDVREKAEAIEKAISTFEREFPDLIDRALTAPLRASLAPYRNVSDGPEHDVLGWLCANQAHALVRQFSRKDPVSTQNGNVHTIAQFIFEAVTGKAPSDNGLLQAVRRVVRSWKPDPRPHF